MKIKRNYYRITTIRGVIGSIFRYFKILFNYGLIDLSDKNFIIFGYNSLTGKLLRAKKCTIFVSFLTYNSLALFFSLFVVTSIFSNASLIFRFVRPFLPSLWLSDLSCHVNFLPGLSLKITALCYHAPYFH